MYSFELFTLQSLHTSPRPVEGPEELNFARVGRGRPDSAEGRGVGAVPPVSIFGFPNWQKIYFWFSMEQTPADARAAPSASGPTDMATETPPSPKRPRDPSSDNKVSQRATTIEPMWPEIQIRTTEILSAAPANACQSLAHPTTPMCRWLKSVDCWVLLCAGLQSRSTSTLLAVKLSRSNKPVSSAADHLCRQLQSLPTPPHPTPS
eukprot:scaffold17672_cov111-Isochrysis_galbana.AAC.4